MAGKKLVAFGVGLVLVAGCGGGGRLSKAQYQGKLQDEGKRLKSDLAGVNLAPGGDVKKLAPAFGKAESSIEQAADDLDKLKPPKDAEADNKQIAKSLHAIAHGFGKMQAAAAAGNSKDLRTIGVSLSNAGQAGSHATQDLKRKGYEIGVFGQ